MQLLSVILSYFCILRIYLTYRRYGLYHHLLARHACCAFEIVLQVSCVQI